MASFFQPTCQGYVLLVHVVPGASRTEVAGLHGGRLKVKVAAPPEKGAANQELLAFLARRLKLAKKALHLTGGSKTRAKVVAIHELSQILAQAGAPEVIGMNKGGTVALNGLMVTMTTAMHSSTIEVEGQMVSAGDPGGFVSPSLTDLLFTMPGTPQCSRIWNSSRNFTIPRWPCCPSAATTS